MPRSITHHLLRIAQEATTNAIRHAEAREIDIRLAYAPGAVSLAISDDGIGFHPETVLTQAGHFGLRGIRARAKKLRGELTLTSSPGEGTEIHVLVPLATTQSISGDAEAKRPQQDPNPACR
jgi:signal transduction histidine kinase